MLALLDHATAVVTVRPALILDGIFLVLYAILLAHLPEVAVADHVLTADTRSGSCIDARVCETFLLGVHLVGMGKLDASVARLSRLSHVRVLISVLSHDVAGCELAGEVALRGQLVLGRLRGRRGAYALDVDLVGGVY